METDTHITPHFTRAELRCRHCGAYLPWPDFTDRLEAARRDVGRPFRILSGHRCAWHNARIGGAPLSQHLRLAVDISLAGHDPAGLHRALQRAGFTGFGFYQTFIHADLGRVRHWFGGRRSEAAWRTYWD